MNAQLNHLYIFSQILDYMYSFCCFIFYADFKQLKKKKKKRHVFKLMCLKILNQFLKLAEFEIYVDWKIIVINK